MGPIVFWVVDTGAGLVFFSTREAAEAYVNSTVMTKNFQIRKFKETEK